MGIFIQNMMRAHNSLIIRGLSTAILLKNPLHLPTFASFHQDTILHIQVVHQWQVRLMHSQIRE